MKTLKRMAIGTCCLLVVLAAQAPVVISAVASMGGETITITSNAVTRIPHLAATLVCPATITAGTTGQCLLTTNRAPAVDTVLQVTSQDPSQFTVPSTVVLKAGTMQVSVPMSAIN